MLNFAMFDTKAYDEPAFRKYAQEAGVEIKFFETKLTRDTVSLAEGFDGVIPFVNDVIDAEVIKGLCAHGVKMIAMRCAGYNNVDLAAAQGKLAVYRVPAYMQLGGLFRHCSALTFGSCGYIMQFTHYSLSGCLFSIVWSE